MTTELPTGGQTAWAARPELSLDAQRDFARLCTLRLLDLTGPKSGREILAELEPLHFWWKDTTVSFPFLHTLAQEGLIAIDGGQPRTYSVTATGQAAMRSLAPHLWPEVEGRVKRFNALMTQLFSNQAANSAS